MKKPFSVMCEEFKMELASLINNSTLPVHMLESILQNYLNDITSIAKNQYQVDKAQYEKFLKEENNKEVTNAG